MAAHDQILAHRALATRHYISMRISAHGDISPTAQKKEASSST